MLFKSEKNFCFNLKFQLKFTITINYCIKLKIIYCTNNLKIEFSTDSFNSYNNILNNVKNYIEKISEKFTKKNNNNFNDFKENFNKKIIFIKIIKKIFIKFNFKFLILKN